eukprot:2035163-Rhodomonas_salina.4
MGRERSMQETSHEISRKFSISLSSPTVCLDLDCDMGANKSTLVGSWLTQQPEPSKQSKLLLYSEKHR